MTGTASTVTAADPGFTVSASTMPLKIRGMMTLANLAMARHTSASSTRTRKSQAPAGQR